MKTTWADSWWDLGQPCDVSMTPISWSNDFALYLDCLMYEHHTLGL